MKRPNASGEIPAHQQKKAKTDAVTTTPLRLTVVYTIHLEEIHLQRSRPLVSTVQAHIATLSDEFGINLRANKICVGDTDVMSNPQALVGSTPIRAELKLEEFVNLLKLKREVDETRTELADNKRAFTDELSEQKMELTDKIRRIEGELGEQKVTLEKHRYLLRGLALDKVVVVANEILLRGAHGGNKRSLAKMTDKEMRRVYHNMLQSDSIRALIYGQNGSSIDAFLTQAVATRSRRNNIAHGDPDLNVHIKEVMESCIPLLDNWRRATFPCFVVRNATKFLKVGQRKSLST
jgi:hypothetical protein